MKPLPQAKKERIKMAERRISGQGQIAVYLGKCFRLFRNEKQWKRTNARDCARFIVAKLET
jgi:hypothetical protein